MKYLQFVQSNCNVMEFIVFKHLITMLAFEVEIFPGEKYRVSHLN